jgi:two-component system alkaline phosphatase synthesis response regulator PhoP
LPKVLLIEDEPDLAQGIRDALEYDGYQVVLARDGDEGLRLTLETRPDLIVLDVMLPKKSGIDLCRDLRQRRVEAPIVMLTARGQESDKILGLEVGADDYMTKPFSIQELLARMRAHLRRVNRQLDGSAILRFGDVQVNFRKLEALKAGRALDLTAREFAILRCLVDHRYQVVTRNQLLDEVWGVESNPVTRTVDNHIVKLRQKLEDVPAEPRYILTVHGVGYRFVLPDVDEKNS